MIMTERYIGLTSLRTDVDIASNSSQHDNIFVSKYVPLLGVCFPSGVLVRWMLNVVGGELQTSGLRVTPKAWVPYESEAQRLGICGFDAGGKNLQST